MIVLPLPVGDWRLLWDQWFCWMMTWGRTTGTGVYFITSRPLKLVLQPVNDSGLPGIILWYLASWSLKLVSSDCDCTDALSWWFFCLGCLPPWCFPKAEQIQSKHLCWFHGRWWQREVKVLCWTINELDDNRFKPSSGIWWNGWLLVSTTAKLLHNLSKKA